MWHPDADQVLGRVVPQHRHQRRVDGQEPSLDGRLIDTEDGALDERAILRFGPAQSVFGAHTLTPPFHFPSLPFYGGNETGEMSFHQKIVGASLERADGDLFADGARDDDEG